MKVKYLRFGVDLWWLNGFIIKQHRKGFMRLKEDQDILREYQAACKIIQKAEEGKVSLLQVEKEEELQEEKVEEMVELLHEIGKMEREENARKLVARLRKKERRIRERRIWRIVGSVAALAVLFVGWQFLSVREPMPRPGGVIVPLAKLSVPTIVYAKEDDEVVAIDSLDLKGGECFVDLQKQPTVGSGEQREIRYNKIMIPRGYTYKVRLADGSSVVLNAGSELKYPVAFEDSVRLVELNGEGFFDVVKSETPFVVKMGEAQVKVYGTKFNALHSEELALSEAVLLEGSIGVRVGDKEVRIVPNERVFHKIGADNLNVEKVNAESYTTWLGCSFKYDGVSLERIAYELSKWYGVKISVAADLKKEFYTMEFDKSSTLEWTMQALGLITGQTIEQEGGGYLIY